MSTGLRARSARHARATAGRVRRSMALALPLAALLLAGCQSGPRPLYHWEGYQAQLYEYFKGEGDGSNPATQLQLLQAQAAKANAAGLALPPGFRAHLGLLLLHMGQTDQAQGQFEAEKAVFPEAAPFMDFLLKRMQANPGARS